MTLTDVVEEKKFYRACCSCEKIQGADGVWRFMGELYIPFMVLNHENVTHGFCKPCEIDYLRQCEEDLEHYAKNNNSSGTENKELA